MRLEKLNIDTQNIIHKFIATCEKGKGNYKSAIIRTFEFLDNKAIKDLTVEDYQLALLNFEEKKTNASYTKSFFWFIFNEGLIIDRDSFMKEFISEINEKRNKNSQGKKPINHKSSYVPSLSFAQILKLEEFLSFDFEEDISKLKSSFFCYMLFCTDCQKEELMKEIKATDYSNGKILTSSGKTYIVPTKYEHIFKLMNNRDKHKGFGNLYDYLKPVELIIEEDKLIPQTLINARNENSLKCSLCGNYFINTSNNWVSVKDRIVCSSCGESLKKNNSYETTLIKEIETESSTLNDDVDKSGYIFGYDKLKKKLLNKPVDYDELNKFFNYIGKLGEAYVYKKEKIKLKDTIYKDLVDDSPSILNNVGYDIKSYTENGEELYIEVKTEAKNKNRDFYITDVEKSIGEKLLIQGKKYLIYRVHNIMSKNEEDVKIDIIDDIFTNNDYSFKVYTWKISKEFNK